MVCWKDSGSNPQRGQDVSGSYCKRGGVSCQVAFGRSHLMDPPHHKLAQAHDRVWGKAGGEFVI